MARRTALYETHLAANGKMVEFAGWELPVQYKGLIEEHQAVRNAAGLFDVSHMGEVFLTGPKALAAAQMLLTNDLSKIVDGQALYCGLLNERGTFVDDVIAYRFSAERILLVVNGANREKDAAWIKEHAFGAQVDDRSDEYGQVAVQGPRAEEIVQKLTRTDLTKVLYYHQTEGEVAGIPCIIARTGYTGEDGLELYMPWAKAPALWSALMEAGAPFGLMPAGLGCRDTLRLEMRFMLYGNDIDEAHTSLEAGLGWTVKLDKSDFIGRAALAEQKAKGLARKLVGFTTEKAIPRHGYRILKDGAEVGQVTSGTQSPSLGRPIGLAYVPTELSSVGATFDLEVRGKSFPATVCKTPFFTPQKPPRK